LAYNKTGSKTGALKTEIDHHLIWTD